MSFGLRDAGVSAQICRESWEALEVFAEVVVLGVERLGFNGLSVDIRDRKLRILVLQPSVDVRLQLSENL